MHNTLVNMVVVRSIGCCGSKGLGRLNSKLSCEVRFKGSHGGSMGSAVDVTKGCAKE